VTASVETDTSLWMNTDAETVAADAAVVDMRADVAEKLD